MSVGRVWAHHVLFAVCGCVTLFQTVHAPGFGLTTKLGLLVVTTEKKIA